MFKSKCSGDSLYPSRAVQVMLNVGRNKMMQLLRDKKVLSKDNLPMPEYTQYFEVRETEHNGFTCKTTYWKPSGVDLTQQLCSEADVTPSKPLSTTSKGFWNKPNPDFCGQISGLGVG